jgi:dTDP-4-amino-4,6-dideoxygalactose transaminase
LRPPVVLDDTRPNYQSYAVRISEEFAVGRDAFMQILLDRGISTRRGIMNAHQEPAYADLPPQKLPYSEVARDTVVLLPLYHTMTDADQDYILDQIWNIAKTGKAN